MINKELEGTNQIISFKVSSKFREMIYLQEIKKDQDLQINKK